MPIHEDHVREALKKVIDPELFVNIVDLGLIYGVDIQEEMLKFLKKRAGSKGLKNVVPVHNSLWDVMLPADSVDLALMVDVYHEFSHPELMLRSLNKAMKKDGLVVLLEFRKEDPKVPIKLLHKMTKDECLREFEANGFHLVKSYDKLPWQHMLFFQKTASPSPKK